MELFGKKLGEALSPPCWTIQRYNLPDLWKWV